MTFEKLEHKSLQKQQNQSLSRQMFELYGKNNKWQTQDVGEQRRTTTNNSSKIIDYKFTTGGSGSAQHEFNHKQLHSRFNNSKKKKRERSISSSQDDYGLHIQKQSSNLNSRQMDQLMSSATQMKRSMVQKLTTSSTTSVSAYDVNQARVRFIINKEKSASTATRSITTSSRKVASISNKFQTSTHTNRESHLIIQENSGHQSSYNLHRNNSVSKLRLSSKRSLADQLTSASRMHAGFLSNTKKPMFNSEMQSPGRPVSSYAAQTVDKPEQSNSAYRTFWQVRDEEPVNRIEAILKVKKEHMKVHAKEQLQVQDKILRQTMSDANFQRNHSKSRSTIQSTSLDNVYSSVSTNKIASYNQALVDFKHNKIASQAHFSDRLVYRLKNQLKNSNVKDIEQKSIECSSIDGLIARDERFIKSDKIAAGVNWSGKVKFLAPKTDAKLQTPKRSATVSVTQKTNLDDEVNEYGFKTQAQKVKVDKKYYTDYPYQENLESKTKDKLEVKKQQPIQNLGKEFRNKFTKKKRYPAQIVDWYKQNKPTTKKEKQLSKSEAHQRKAKEFLTKKAEIQGEKERIAQRKRNKKRGSQNSSDALVDKTKQKNYMERQQLLTCMLYLPTLVTSKKDRYSLHNSEEDKFYIDGCEQMANHQFEDALQNFRWMAQKLAELSLSEIEETLPSDDNNSLEKQSIRASDMQDMLSFCSRLEKFILPSKLLRFIDFRSEKSHSNGFSPQNSDKFSQESTVINKATDTDKRNKILLQMAAINSGFCQAQCGYVRNSILSYKKATGEHFDVVIMYNLAILQLLRKKPDLIACLLYLRLVIDKLAHEDSAVWLNLTLIKQGCLRIIEVMKHMIYDFEQSGQIDSLEDFHHKVFSRVTMQKTLEGMVKKPNSQENLDFVDRPPTAFLGPLQDQFEILIRQRPEQKSNLVSVRLLEELFQLEELTFTRCFESQIDLFDKHVVQWFEKNHEQEMHAAADEAQNIRTAHIKKDFEQHKLRWTPGKPLNYRRMAVQKLTRSTSAELRTPNLNQIYLKNYSSEIPFDSLISKKNQPSSEFEKSLKKFAKKNDLDLSSEKKTKKSKVQTQPQSPKILKPSKDYHFINPVIEQDDDHVSGKSPPFSDYSQYNGQVDSDLEKVINASSHQSQHSNRNHGNSKSSGLQRQTLVRANYDEKVDRIYRFDTMDQLNQNVMKNRNQRHQMNSLLEIYDKNDDDNDSLGSEGSKMMQRGFEIHSDKNSNKDQANKIKNKASMNIRLDSQPSTNMDLDSNRLKLFNDSFQEKQDVIDRIRDDDIRVMNMGGGVYTQDIYRERTTEAERQYFINKITIRNLKARVEYMEWYSRQRQNDMLMSQVRRLQQLRKHSNYNQLFNINEGNHLDELEITRRLKKSFSQAFSQKPKCFAYAHRLRIQEIELIMNYKQMVDNGHLADFQMVFEITNRFPFLLKWNYSLRQKLIAKARIKVYGKNEVIFKQGDPSPELFLILRGTCAVKFSKPEWMGIEITCTTFYDGQSFGELFDEDNDGKLSKELTKSLQLQKYTATANEECYVLQINKKEIKKDLEHMNELNAEVEGYEDRLLFLQKCDLFRDVAINTLLPIANTLKPKRFTLGQVILKQGQVPEGLYLVSQGCCKVGLDYEATDYKLRSLNQWNAEDPTPMKHGYDARDVPRYPDAVRENLKGYNYDSDGDIIQSINSDEVAELQLERARQNAEEDETSEIKLPPKRIFINQKTRTSKASVSPQRPHEIKAAKKAALHQQFKYTKWQEYFKLQTRDYFGGRVLFHTTHAEEEKQGQATFKTPENRAAPSMLTVIADSAEVEVLIMDKTNWSFFPEAIQKDVQSKLQRKISVERPYEPEYLDFVKDLFKQWENDRLQYYIKTAESQWMAKHNH